MARDGIKDRETPSLYHFTRAACAFLEKQLTVSNKCSAFGAVKPFIFSSVCEDNVNVTLSTVQCSSNLHAFSLITKTTSAETYHQFVIKWLEMQLKY